jgi:transitional endoplasmic reticulum ATPase
MPVCSKIEWSWLADKMKGYTGADMKAVCREAAFEAIKRSFQSNLLTLNDFLKAIESIPPSLTNEQVLFYENLSRTF